ncbi:hypothetical protein [Streptomyces sp. NPDC005476]|uniref:hypothetical protein n=1 Tax=Streptomyces sp. NPDC005476 TaxID=3156882 RepID=UPI0034511446
MSSSSIQPVSGWWAASGQAAAMIDWAAEGQASPETIVTWLKVMLVPWLRVAVMSE